MISNGYQTEEGTVYSDETSITSSINQANKPLGAETSASVSNSIKWLKSYATSSSETSGKFNVIVKIASKDCSEQHHLIVLGLY